VGEGDPVARVAVVGRAIAFTALRLTETSAELTVSLSDDDPAVAGEWPLVFECNQPVLLDEATVGYAMCTLLSPLYDDVRFEFDVPADVGATAERLLGRSVVPAPVPPRGVDRTLLNFSGGFDSLVAKLLAPPGTRLVSLDFGGRFSRERQFFEGFTPTIWSTNLVQTPLRSGSWAFMGVGTVLSRHQHHPDGIAFGTILEAGPQNLRRTRPSAVATHPSFSAIGLQNVPLVSGLTEVGTALVLLRHAPDLVGDSLRSLAGPGEEKLFRKYALTRCVAERHALDAELPDVATPTVPRLAWGEAFSTDFLALWMARHASPDVSALMVAGMPTEVRDAALGLSLDLFERYDPRMYDGMREEERRRLFTRLEDLGIGPYTETDETELEVVAELLSPWHGTR
jgi:hypothetical protein